MKSINFPTCKLTEYAINGDTSNPIRINLLDVNLKQRIAEAGARMEEIEQKYSGTLTVEQVIAADKEIREFLNYVFDADVATSAFGSANCLTKVDDLPLYAHFFKSFAAMLIEDLKEIAARHKAEQSSVNQNVEKYVVPAIIRQQPLAPLANPMGAIDVSGLSDEQKAALLKQLLT